MPRVWRLLVIGVVALLASSFETAMGQVPFRQYGPDPVLDRPVLSPYYNLMRSERGTSGTNYQNYVLPQLQAMQAAQTQQRQIQQLQRQVAQGASPEAAGAAKTGHRTYFGNYSHFYGAGPQIGQSGARRR